MDPPSLASGWTLPDALGVVCGDVVALTGAGGKTTTLFALARALAVGDRRVVVAVTTHLGREQSGLAPHHLVWEGAGDASSQLQSALAASPIVLVTGPPVEGGLRWGGMAAGWVAAAAATPGVDVVLVEADGARGLSFKAPAPHEPVVPPCTTLLVPVAAIDAIGRPLAEVAHRPEQVTRLAGPGMADRVTAALMAAVLAHPQGGLKGRPAGARVRVLINKVEDRAAVAAGRKIADQVLAAGGPDTEAIEAVVLAAVATQRPVCEVRRRVAPIILAAGRSLRMGGDIPKLLLPWDGVPVIRRAVETAAACPGLAGPPHVVVGAFADEVVRALAGTGARVVHNPDYAEGEMLSSLQAGVRALPAGTAACLVLLGDQPWTESAVVEEVLAGYAGGPAGLVAPAYRGRRGHPVLIDRRYWPELLALPRGSAPRDLLARYPDEIVVTAVETNAILRDMDTWQEYRQALAAWRR